MVAGAERNMLTSVYVTHGQQAVQEDGDNTPQWPVSLLRQRRVSELAGGFLQDLLSMGMEQRSPCDGP